MYKEPIKISANDPICTATALEGTVIGILFDKTGADIIAAIDHRTANIDKKVIDLQGAIKDADAFIEAKDKEIDKLDDLYDERSDAKKEKLEPLRRESRDIWKKIQDEEHLFDKETEKSIAGQAVIFEQGFDEAQKNLSVVDDLLEKEKKTGVHGLQGIRGYLCTQGTTSCQEESRGTGYGDSVSYITSDGSSAYKTTTGNVGLGDSNPSAKLVITQQEDKAMARLNTLKRMVREYSGKITGIRNWILDLQEEKRRIMLIRNNLDPKRDYKLDLNKLSAFGFEDVEITG